MREASFAVTTLILGTLFTIATGLTVPSAEAATHHTIRHATRKNHVTAHFVRHVRAKHFVHARKVALHVEYHRVAISKHHANIRHVKHAIQTAHARHYTHVAGISCVPFARQDSGISLPGNAWAWWGNAAGVYSRGRIPQPGAVLTFRSNPHMPLGHVAVVTKVINPREIEIDQANWVHGRITRGVPVVDVSEANDWTAVRVEMGHSGSFGSVYPTYGFIYDKPDNGTVLAAAHAPAPQPVLNAAPSDLRPVAEQPWQTYEEVAELPSTPRHYVRPHPVLTMQHAHAQSLEADRR